jgi:hypothetical protein
MNPPTRHYTEAELVHPYPPLTTFQIKKPPAQWWSEPLVWSGLLFLMLVINTSFLSR